MSPKGEHDTPCSSALVGQVQLRLCRATAVTCGDCTGAAEQPGTPTLDVHENPMYGTEDSDPIMLPAARQERAQPRHSRSSRTRGPSSQLTPPLPNEPLQQGVHLDMGQPGSSCALGLLPAATSCECIPKKHALITASLQCGMP